MNIGEERRTFVFEPLDVEIQPIREHAEAASSTIHLDDRFESPPELERVTAPEVVPV